MTEAPVYSVFEKPAVLEEDITITEHIERWTEDREAADRTVDSIRSFVKGLCRTPPSREEAR